MSVYNRGLSDSGSASCGLPSRVNDHRGATSRPDAGIPAGTPTFLGVLREAVGDLRQAQHPGSHPVAHLAVRSRGHGELPPDSILDMRHVHVACAIFASGSACEETACGKAVRR
jgi:hypothetical protein